MSEHVTAIWQPPLIARAAETGDGVPCVVIERGEDPDACMALSLNDARTLCAGLIQALAHHGDETAREIGDAYLTCTTCRGSRSVLVDGRWADCPDCGPAAETEVAS